MSNQLRIGMIGLDTSHVTAFTSILNDPSHQYHVPGGRVTVAYPGGSKDFPLSYSRVDQFSSELRDVHQVKLMDSPEAVAEAADLIFIESVDGRVHLQQFEQIAGFRKPVFIDKPLALSVADARKILMLAEKHGISIMSCSALRYSDALIAMLGRNVGPIAGCDVFGPMAEEPTQPGLFWYGIHTIDMIVRIMGTGCAAVQGYHSDSTDSLIFSWADGRTAALRGMRNAHSSFGATVHFRESVEMTSVGAAPRPFYASMMEAIMRSLPANRPEITHAEMLETIRLIEAANAARRSGGDILKITR